VKYGIYSPGFGAFSNPQILAELARDAEDAGWDGFFLWDHVHFADAPIGDPWITLTVMATVTSHIRLGTVITPVPRRRPWKLAREVVTLDHLSLGRAILGVGIGDDRWGREYSAFGEQMDERVRGEMLDEGLDILAGLWSGKAFSYEGKHYHLDHVTFLPEPLQKPRIPVWVAATWPNRKPFRRAARWDGVITASGQGGLTPANYREIRTYVDQFRQDDAPYDVVRPAGLPTGDRGAVAEAIAEYEEAGVTWWLVPLEDDMGPLDELGRRVRNGPPRE